MAIDSDKKTMINVIMSHELKATIQRVAKEDAVPMSAQVVYIIEQYLKERAD